MICHNLLILTFFDPQKSSFRENERGLKLVQKPHHFSLIFSNDQIRGFEIDHC